MLIVRPASCAGLLCLTLAGSAFAQLTFDRAQVSFAVAPEPTAPVTQTLSLSAMGANLPFSAAVRYVGSQTGWLSINPQEGNTPANLTLTVDASHLPRGLYVAQVTAESGVAGAYTTVLLSVGPAKGKLNVSPSVLTFTAEPGDKPEPATLSVTDPSGGAAPVQFTASASFSDNWLIVYPFPTTTPASLIVATGGPLAAGTYYGAITITPTEGGDPTVVPVVLQMSASAGTLALSQTALTFNYQTGSAAPPDQPVDIYPVGTRTQSFTATTIAPWLRLRSTLDTTPGSSVTASAPTRLTVTANATSLTPGQYNGAVRITGADGNAINVPVAFNVAATPVVNALPSSVAFGEATGMSGYLTLVGNNGSFIANITPAAPWLTISPASGTINGGATFISMLADATNLASGTYDTTISVTTFGNNGSSISVPVHLTVTGADDAVHPTIRVPAQAALAGIVGQANPVATLDVGMSIAGSTQAFTAAAVSRGGWLRAEPFMGDAPAKVALSADITGLKAGRQDGSVLVTSLATGETFTVPVTLDVAAPALSVSPATLSFAQTQRHVLPQPQSVRVTANVAGTFTASSASNWITITPASGSTPASFSVRADPTGLPPGNSTGTIKVTGPNNTVNIPVSLAVLPPPAPVTTSDSLTFDYAMGNKPPDGQTLLVKSTDDEIPFAVAAATSSGGNWLVVTPSSGVTPASISVAVDVTRIIPGTYSGTITLSVPDSSASPRVIKVALNVAASDVAVTSVLNSASFAPTAVAPGQLVSIMGTGLGPFSGVTARASAAGAIGTQLSDVRVLFDGTPSPVLFARGDQVNAVVPYAVAGRASTRVQVQYETSLSIPVELRVVDAAPGIFTATGSGRDQAAALNTDFSANSLANPAPRGSTVMLFGTGEGQTDPLGQDGRIIGADLRRPVLAVVAAVGGEPAEVSYIGSAPGMVSGVFQANVRIPDGVAPGAVEIQIIVGGVASQPGVTIAVR